MDSSRVDKYHQRLLALRSRLVDEIRDAAENVTEKVQAPGEVSNLPTHTAYRDSEGLDEGAAVEVILL